MKIRKGVMRNPPPTPNNPDNTPTAKLKNKRKKIKKYSFLNNQVIYQKFYQIKTGLKNLKNIGFRLRLTVTKY